MTVDNVAASSNQRGQPSSQTQQQFISSAFPPNKHSTAINHTHHHHAQPQLTCAPSASSSSSLSNEDAINLQNPFADSPKTFGYSRSVANCGPTSYPVPDYGHAMETYHDVAAYPRNMDDGYCAGMSSYPGSHCSEPCFSQ